MSWPVGQLLCGLTLVCTGTGWVQNPIARHVACAAGVNEVAVCRLQGYDEAGGSMVYNITSLPEAGTLYPLAETSTLEVPVRAQDPIAAQQLPFQITDAKHRVIYMPPFDTWESHMFWSSFTYVVSVSASPAFETVTSEEGRVVLTTSSGVVVSANFDTPSAMSGWSISGNERWHGSRPAGLKQLLFHWGDMHHYVYGADEALNLNFSTGIDEDRWRFEAAPHVFGRPQVVTTYGGFLRFRIRSMYGDFTELNNPLDWVTLECSSCDGGRGIRLVRFADERVHWDGTEVHLQLPLSVDGFWRRDPWNALEAFEYATECEIAAVLTNLSRVAILGDFTRGAEAVAIDDVEILADTSKQPAYPVACQRGCYCKYNDEGIHPSCC